MQATLPKGTVVPVVYALLPDKSTQTYIKLFSVLAGLSDTMFTGMLHSRRPIVAELVGARAVDPHSFYADPDPAVFLNADPDPDPDPDPGLGPA